MRTARRPDDAAQQRRRRCARRRRRRRINHYNLFRSAEINGSAAPGFSSGQALQAMEQLSSRVAAAGDDLRVVGPVARGDHRPAASRPLIFGLGLLLVYLTLAGAVREPDAAVHHPAVGAAGDPRRAARAVGPRADQRRLLPDRPGDADRPVGQERHPDRRVRRAAARRAACRSPTPRSRRRASGCGRF